MTRGKPLILSRKPGSSVREENKREAEAAFRTPALPKTPPLELHGMPAAKKAWRKLAKAHAQLPGQLFNSLDLGYLIGYCLAVQARQKAIELEEETNHRYLAGELNLSDLIKVRSELRMAVRLCGDMEKQIYGTPKSRGGISPESKDDDPMEAEMRSMMKLLEKDDC